MEAFLLKTKKELTDLSTFSEVNIVLGNESCDLDSAVSAIVYAFYLSQRKNNPLSPCIPCLNINFEDLALRTETIHYLEENNIDPSSLTYRDQIDLGELHRDQRLRLYLVDHNALPIADSELESAVVQVVDHHSYPGDDAPDGIIELVGSCSTLVAEHLLQEDSDWVETNIDETVAKLLIGTILFDTVNLLESAGRVTPKDIRMVEDLQRFCSDLNQDKIYQQLHDAKFDVSGLSTFDLLRKDFKTVSRKGFDEVETIIGISSVTIEMENILQRSDMRDACESFCKSRNLQTLIVMTISVDSDGNAERWLLLYNPGNAVCQEIIDRLKENQQLELSILNEEEEGVTLFKQENPKVSRKILMPVLQTCLDKINQASFFVGNVNNSALGDFSAGGKSSNELLDFDPFGSSAVASFETEMMSENNKDPFGGLDMFAGESLIGDQDSSQISFDPFATIIEDDPSFTSPKSPQSPSGHKGTADISGLDPFGASEQLLNLDDPFTAGGSQNIQQNNLVSFDPFQTISPSSDSFNSQEDLLGAPPAPADPFDIFSNQTSNQSTEFQFGTSNEVASNKYSDGFDLLGGPLSTPKEETDLDKTHLITDDVKVPENNGCVSSFEFVEKSDCVEELIPKNIPPTPKNSYADMSELQKFDTNKEFDHDELFKKVQNLDSVSGDNVIIFASEVSNNGFCTETSNGLRTMKENHITTNFDDNNQQEQEVSNNRGNHRVNEKSSPVEVDDSKPRTTSCGSEGSASYTDDLSDSSSGDSYSLNEIPQYASHHVITEIQEEEEEEEEDQFIIQQNNVNNSNKDISSNLEDQVTVNKRIKENNEPDNQTSIPAIVIDEVQNRRHSEEEVDVPYIVVEEVENMNFSDDEEMMTPPITQSTEETTEETSQSGIQRVDSEAVEEYVENIVDSAINTINMENSETNGQVNNNQNLQTVNSVEVEEYIEHVVGSAINTINMENSETNVQLNNNQNLQTVNSVEVEEYVEHVVGSAINTINLEHKDMNEQSKSSQDKALQRIDSDAVEEYVENAVGAAIRDINMDGAAETVDISGDPNLQMKESTATLQRIDSDVVEEYVGNVVKAAVDNLKMNEPENMDNNIGITEPNSKSSAIEVPLIIPNSATLDQSIPHDSGFLTHSNEDSPNESKRVLALSMDLDLDDEDSDNEMARRERSSSAVNVIEEMAAAANQNKEPLKRPTDFESTVSRDDSINSPVSGLSFDALTPDGEVEFVESLVAAAPQESTPKKPLTVDDDVMKKISIDWNEDADIIARAEERQKTKEEDAKRRTLDKTLSDASFAAKIRMSNVSIKEEWQDDGYSHQKLQSTSVTLDSQDSFFEKTVPTLKSSIEEEQYDDKIVQLDGATLKADYSLRDRRLTTDSAVLDAAFPVDDDNDDEEDDDISAFDEEKPVPPSSLNIGGARPKHKKKVNIPAGLTLDMEAVTDDSQAPNDSAILTPSSTEMSWEDETPVSSKAITSSIPAEPIPEYTAKEEYSDRHNWRKVSIGGTEHTIDMNVINPYRKVLSHGGYYGDGLNAIIVFASCYMPDKTRKDYNYVMDNLFLYIVSTLELLVAKDYMIIYFHGAASRRKVPGMAWMRRCYKLVDRKLRKNLKGLYIVHPTMWLKTVVGFTKPFISSKFSSKLKFIYQLDELNQLVPMEYVYVPEEVRKFDMKRTQKENEGFWGWISVMLELDDDSASATSDQSDTDSDFVMDSYIPSVPLTDNRDATNSRTLPAEPGRIQFSSSESDSEKPNKTKCFVNDSFYGSKANDDEFIEDDYMKCHMTSSTLDTRVLSPHPTISGGTTPRMQSPHGILQFQEDDLEVGDASSVRDWLLYPEADSWTLHNASGRNERNNETDLLIDEE